ncbi:hypothetical protein [Microvirga yunnanensis]|uniref:hypothetical protein n=1 Tax=Microvirga yunnanensis TaxID=2953740 RepID=UPI0021C85832|nr:hypothetical protein [Microvirga sp. HBU65207]
MTPALLPVSGLKVVLSKSRPNLGQIDLPGRALGTQHPGRHEVVQSSLLRVAGLAARWGRQKNKGSDDQRTKTRGSRSYD